MQLIYNVKDKPKFGQLIVSASSRFLLFLRQQSRFRQSSVTECRSRQLFSEQASAQSFIFSSQSLRVPYSSARRSLSSVQCSQHLQERFQRRQDISDLSSVLFFAGLVYVVIAIAVKVAGVKWINKLMPAVVIGPTVSIIGLSLAGNAVGDLTLGKVMTEVTTQTVENGKIVDVVSSVSTASPYVALICGLITLFTVVICSVYGKKMTKLIPFIIGILAGYVAAAIFTVIGIKTDNTALQVIDFTVFHDLKLFSVPDFTFLEAAKGAKEIDGQYLATVAVAYVPVAFVVFAEHIADHKNLSSIIEQDLLEEPGLHRTLLGDGVGSMFGAIFGGCPNTTYGESVGCVAITGNASVVTILATAIMCMIISFFGPFVTFLASIPNCVMGGVCITLYGFIAVSGLKMIQQVDLDDNKNLFVVAVILICGIGGLTVNFGKVTLTSIACALILGIITNVILSKKGKKA